MLGADLELIPSALSRTGPISALSSSISRLYVMSQAGLRSNMVLPTESERMCLIFSKIRSQTPTYISMEGGRIIIHEMLFNDDGTGPFPVAAFNVDMLVAMPGQQYSGRELETMLREAGFTSIEVKPTFGYWSVVTGRKAS
jgi:hypothetical protein